MSVASCELREARVNETRSFDWGMVAGMFFLIAANAGHWLITPGNHPGAGAVQQTFGAAQFLVCSIGAIWIVRRQRSRPAPQSLSSANVPHSGSWTDWRNRGAAPI